MGDELTEADKEAIRQKQEELKAEVEKAERDAGQP